MKTKDFKNTRTKTKKELLTLISQKRLEYGLKKVEVSSGKEKNLKLPLNIRREIAKILTLVREKEIIEKLK